MPRFKLLPGFSAGISPFQAWNISFGDTFTAPKTFTLEKFHRNPIQLIR